MKKGKNTWSGSAYQHAYLERNRCRVLLTQTKKPKQADQQTRSQKWREPPTDQAEGVDLINDHKPRCEVSSWLGKDQSHT